MRKQSLLKEPITFSGDALLRESSPSLSPRSSSPRSSSSSQRVTLSGLPTINPADYPFPSMDSESLVSSSTGEALPGLPRAGSTFSDTTIRFRPSMSHLTTNASRRPTYNTWLGPRDFPSPNIYDLTLKMNADIGIDSFWENIIDILVTNFYASRVTLSIPYDLTDISNMPWGLKATYNGSITRQRTRIS